MGNQFRSLQNRDELADILERLVSENTYELVSKTHKLRNKIFYDLLAFLFDSLAG